MLSIHRCLCVFLVLLTFIVVVVQTTAPCVQPLPVVHRGHAPSSPVSTSSAPTDHKVPVTMSSKRTEKTAGRNVPTATPDPAWETTWKHDKHGVAPLSNTLARDSAFGTGSASIVQWRRGNQSKYGVALAPRTKVSSTKATAKKRHAGWAQPSEDDHVAGPHKSTGCDWDPEFVPDGLAEEVITSTSVAAMLSATGCQIDVSELGNSRDIASLIAGFMNWMLAKIRMEKSGGSDAAQAAAAQDTKATAAPVRVAATASSSDIDKEEAVKLNTKRINASFVKRPPRSFEIIVIVDYPEAPIKHYCEYFDHDLPYTEERTLGRLETVARLMVDGVNRALQAESTCVTNFDLLGMEDKLKLPRYDKIKKFRHSRAHANLDDWERNMISRRIFSVEQFNYWLGTGGPFGGIVLEYLLPCPGRKFLIEGGRYCIPTDLFIEKLKAGMFKMQ